MDISDFISLIALVFSGLSLCLSLWAVVKSSKFSNYQLRLSNRAELHKMLLEIDRECLHDPSLHSMFKSESVTDRASSNLSTDSVKQETYIKMYLNMFELSFAQFKQIKSLSSSEKEIAEAWDHFIIYFFRNCTSASAIWSKISDTYYVSFRDYIENLITSNYIDNLNTKLDVNLEK